MSSAGGSDKKGRMLKGDEEEMRLLEKVLAETALDASNATAHNASSEEKATVDTDNVWRDLSDDEDKGDEVFSEELVVTRRASHVHSTTQAYPTAITATNESLTEVPWLSEAQRTEIQGLIESLGMHLHDFNDNVDDLPSVIGPVESQLGIQADIIANPLEDYGQLRQRLLGRLWAPGPTHSEELAGNYNANETDDGRIIPAQHGTGLSAPWSRPSQTATRFGIDDEILNVLVCAGYTPSLSSLIVSQADKLGIDAKEFVSMLIYDMSFANAQGNAESSISSPDGEQEHSGKDKKTSEASGKSPPEEGSKIDNEKLTETIGNTGELDPGTQHTTPVQNVSNNDNNSGNDLRSELPKNGLRQSERTAGLGFSGIDASERSQNHVTDQQSQMEAADNQAGVQVANIDDSFEDDLPEDFVETLPPTPHLQPNHHDQPDSATQPIAPTPPSQAVQPANQFQPTSPPRPARQQRPHPTSQSAPPHRPSQLDRRTFGTLSGAHRFHILRGRPQRSKKHVFSKLGWKDRK
ncbi:hypothetical protein BDV96DRAFT_650505 [Lophiotrema nucula]|uniref:Uncharacterized protein n=1 Tax=Lophiotrema nucula TaxID=690887 RepID=A0A6A5YXR5_9PLEO|nr:hypothetical protein BDV96DRAFT_650505 [Lophiotrema nucula]